MRESAYQSLVIKKLKERFPGCYVTKQPTDQKQGLPDLLILHNDRWAMLEVKVSRLHAVQPNQEYYVREFNNMSYAAFIYPENEEQILDELQLALGDSR